VSDKCDEAITPSGDVGHVSGPVAAVTKCFAQIGDMHPKITFLDDDVGPDPVDQFPPAHNVPRTLDKIDQDVQSTPAHRYGSVLLHEQSFRRN
jgi:hypothetical protein